MTKTPKQLFEEGFLLLDLETTGLPKTPDVAIVEVAVIDHEGTVLMNTLVNPEFRIPVRASGVHGIYDVDVAEADTFADIYPQLASIIEERDVVAYNHDFEQAIFQIVCNRYEQPNFPTTTWHCAMRAYSNHRGARRFYKLTDACYHEHIMVADAHRALGDCIMTLQLMRKMAGLPVSS